MKIIEVSNFNNESVSDSLVAKAVHPCYTEFITDALNERYSGATSSSFFRAVEDDYKLYIFRP